MELHSIQNEMDVLLEWICGLWKEPLLRDRFLFWDPMWMTNFAEFEYIYKDKIYKFIERLKTVSAI